MRLALRAAGLTLVASCSRTPAEPSTSSTPVAPSVVEPATTKPAAAPASGDERCVRLSPAQPPPGAEPAPAGRCPPDPGGAGKLAVADVVFPDASNTKLEVEIARSSAESERGLMYRTKMADDHGMIFALGERKEHVFWMHNTCIPLDMLFVDGDGLIVGILENVPTLNDEERTVGCPSTIVIETNAGWTRKHGVRAGQHVKLPTL